MISFMRLPCVDSLFAAAPQWPWGTCAATSTSRTLLFLMVLWILPNMALAQRGLSVEGVEFKLQQQQASVHYAESHALVIGVANYKNGWARLPGVPSDVQAVAELLLSMGFEVTTVIDPTYAELDRALRSFVSRYGQQVDNRLFIYFAGHGYTLTTNAGNKLGYVVPVDAPLPGREPAEFRTKAYSMETFETLSRQIEARHVLFVFDSCFAGTIFRPRGNVPDVVNQHISRPVRQFITAGDENQQVSDYSIFRRQFEAALKDGDADLNGDGYVTGSELGIFLEDRVTNYTKTLQTPRWGKINDPFLDKGDYVFSVGIKRSQIKPSADRDDQSVVQERIIGSAFRDCLRCPEMVVVQAGDFLMGSPPDEDGHIGRERPVRHVRIASRFAIGRYEITVREFATFVTDTNYVTVAEKTGCHSMDLTNYSSKALSPRALSWRKPGFLQDDNHPVVCVSVADIEAYIKWLDKRSQKTYRLPSEAEWEYAARAGSRTSRPWGVNPSDACLFANVADLTRLVNGAIFDGAHKCSDKYAFTAPVGNYARNVFGLHDMIGNVFEFTQDCFHGTFNYSSPEIPSDGRSYTGPDCAYPSQIYRGGSWMSGTELARSAFRQSAGSRSFSSNDVGFRLVRTLP